MARLLIHLTITFEIITKTFRSCGCPLGDIRSVRFLLDGRFYRHEKSHMMRARLALELPSIAKVSTVVCLLACSTLVSCGIFGPAKKQPSTEAKHVENDEDEVEDAHIDTIEWTHISEAEVPPITSRRPSSKSVVKSTYHVVLLAPFDASDFRSTSDRLNGRMLRMLEFYVGTKYALDFLIHDVSIDFSVIDTESQPFFDRDFADHPKIAQADIIIGPYFTENVEALSNFAAREGKVLLSPWNTTPFVRDNPFYVQMRPSLQLHAQALTTFARSRFPSEKLMLLTKNEKRDTAILKYFQQTNRMVDESVLVKLRELLVDDIADPSLSEHITTIMLEDSIRSFIIPIWSDEPFVIAALAKLNYAKADQDLTVFGLPQWMEMKKMDYDYYENLNVHVSSAKPAVYDRPDDRRLRAYYFERLGSIPGTEVYYGKDLMVWLASLLQHHGTIITEGFTNSQAGLTTQQFEIGAVYGGDGETIDYYENRYLQILRFKDYKFRPVQKF